MGTWSPEVKTLPLPGRFCYGNFGTACAVSRGVAGPPRKLLDTSRPALPHFLFMFCSYLSINQFAKLGFYDGGHIFSGFTTRKRNACQTSIPVSAVMRGYAKEAGRIMERLCGAPHRERGPTSRRYISCYVSPGSVEHISCRFDF